MIVSVTKHGGDGEISKKKGQMNHILRVTECELLADIKTIKRERERKMNYSEYFFLSLSRE